MYTLTLKKDKKPLSLDGVELTQDSSFPVYEASSVNEIALQIMTGSLVIGSDMIHRIRVAKLDFNEILNNRFLKNMSESQDLTSSLKLVPIQTLSGTNSIRSKRPARMYFKDKSLMPSLESDKADLTHVVRVPKFIGETLCKGDTIMACYDDYGTIDPSDKFKIIGRADEQKLIENLSNIDTEKYMYFMAY